jgi:hypothetical protein
MTFVTDWFAGACCAAHGSPQLRQKTGRMLSRKTERTKTGNVVRNSTPARSGCSINEHSAATSRKRVRELTVGRQMHAHAHESFGAFISLELRLCSTDCTVCLGRSRFRAT